MGGVIAQLVARDHPDVISGLVLSGTCQHFQDAETRRLLEVDGRRRRCCWAWRPAAFYRGLSQRQDPHGTERTAWWLSELMRHEARDVAEAGRELGRFDSRPWLASLSRRRRRWCSPRRDQMVSPAKQRELAQAAARGVRGAHRPPRASPTRADDVQPGADLSDGGGGGARAPSPSADTPLTQVRFCPCAAPAS